MSKFNKFDLWVMAVFTTFVLIVIFSFVTKSSVEKTKVNIVVKVSNSDTIKALTPTLGNTKTVFVNGSNAPVNQILYYDDGANGKPAQNLYIVLQAPGKVGNESNSTFNGERILINQKVEIHGNYVALGYVTDIKNAN